MSGALSGASHTFISFNPNESVRRDPHFIAEKTYSGQLVKETRFKLIHSIYLFTLYLVPK